jgi:hypothetical protein
MGTEATEVAVFVSVDGSKPAYMLGAQHAIKGENPTGDTIQDQVDGSDNSVNHRERGRLAMVWKESSGRQFDAYDQTPAFPLIGDDDPDDPDSTYGRGLTQLTLPEPTRQQVWDWVENLKEGVEHFDNNYSNTQSTIEGWYDHWENPPDQPTHIANITSWAWDPNNVNGNYEMKTDAEIEAIKQLFEDDSIDIQRQDDDWGNEEFYVRDAADATDPPWSVHTPENSTREENHFDGQQVSKILNMQAYLQFNAGSGAAGFPAIVDEFGIIRRRIADDTWGNLTGYINHYDGEPWNS